jgi:hypothetical protein
MYNLTVIDLLKKSNKITVNVTIEIRAVLVPAYRDEFHLALLS